MKKVSSPPRPSTPGLGIPMEMTPGQIMEAEISATLLDDPSSPWVVIRRTVCEVNLICLTMYFFVVNTMQWFCFLWQRSRWQGFPTQVLPSHAWQCFLRGVPLRSNRAQVKIFLIFLLNVTANNIKRTLRTVLITNNNCSNFFQLPWPGLRLWPGNLDSCVLLSHLSFGNCMNFLSVPSVTLFLSHFYIFTLCFITSLFFFLFSLSYLLTFIFSHFYMFSLLYLLTFICSHFYIFSLFVSCRSSPPQSSLHLLLPSEC